MGYLFPVLSPPADLIVYREEELGNLIYPFQTTDIFKAKIVFHRVESFLLDSVGNYWIMSLSLP